MERRELGRALIAVAVTLGLGLGYLLVPRSDPVDDPKLVAPEIALQGFTLPRGAEAEAVALEHLRARVRDWFELGLPSGEIRKIPYAKLGAQIDKSRLKRLILDAQDSTSPLRRSYRRQRLTGPVELPAPLVLDTELGVALLTDLKEELDREPIDARLDLGSGGEEGATKPVTARQGRVLGERVGWSLDVDASLAAISDALSAGAKRAVLVVKSQLPARTAAQLASVRHDRVLAVFETPYDRAERAAARTFNLRQATTKLDGTVLMPGERFDFNAVVGPRDEAHGYRVAPVIAEGELVDGIGGGTCQVSGTLHGAAFFAGLEIVERSPHTRPSSYIKMGMDATVVYPTINLGIKNPHPFPVVLHETVRDGVVRAEILGGGEGPTVTLVRRVLSAIPYQEVERPERSLPLGKRRLAQRGVPGFKLKRYRILRHAGHAVREGWTESYPPTTQVVLVGTGEGPLEALGNDPHPEYRADELLVLTATPQATGDPTLSTQREEGRFGQEGWTEREGMPTFRAD